MPSPVPAPPRPLVLLLAWGGLALAFLPQALMLNLGRPLPWPWWLAAAHNVSIFALWAALTPLAWHAVRRWPPFGAQRVRNGLRLALVALLLSALHVLAMALFVAAFDDRSGLPVRLLVGTAIGLAATDLLVATGVLAALIALLQSDARRRAERQLVEARLVALRHQLQPHFLFNTLNALAELVHADATRAEALLLRLCALLRRALDDAPRERVALREELDFLDDYLAIQQALLGERLRVQRDIAPDTLDLGVPPMLLQPLVENALRHGIGPRRGGGTLRLRAYCEAGMLCLSIEDDGVGATAPLREGIGLGNTRARLQAEYAEAAALTIDAASGRGVSVVLRLPAVRA